MVARGERGRMKWPATSGLAASTSTRRATLPAGMSMRVTDFVNRSFRHWSLLPAVLLFAALTLYPMANLARMAVSTIEFSHGAEVWAFTPMRNVALLRADEVVPPAVRNTLVFVVAAVAIEMVLGLALALLVAGVSRGKGLVRTVMILPILVPPVAIGSMWKLMYNYDFGIFNQTLAALGAAPVNWLGSTSLALTSVIVVDIWHWVPFVFLILFAAVEGLPVDLLEAARVDGATRWQVVWRIMIPLLRPAIVVAFLFRTILAFKVFDEVYLLTSGGPGTSTELINLHLYKVFFEQNQLGYGALLSLAVIAAIVSFLLVARRAATAVRAQ
jgi:multiple sugar transport system permease protein